MNRAQLEHIIRAAGTVADDDDIIVIGSQSILGEHPLAPAELLVSTEADVYPRNHPDRWDLIDGTLGEGSPFHEAFGYYAQGVDESTATLPAGWKQRLVPVRNDNTRGVTGWCLEPHDLAVAKLVANRDKDRRFLRAAARHALLDLEVLETRIGMTEVLAADRAALVARARALFA